MNHDCNNRAFSSLLPLLLAGAFVVGAMLSPPAVAQTCIDDVTNRTNVCTANDVRIFSIEVLDEIDPCVFVGDTGTYTIRYELIATAAERWDIGVFFAEDGGDARVGMCARDYLPPDLNPDEPACTGVCDGGSSCFKDADCPVGETCSGGYDPDSGAGPYYDGECSEDPGDMCGDIEQGVPTFKEVTITFTCADNNLDGFADIGTCVSWDNNKSDGSPNKPSCLVVEDTVPNTKSKCRCEDLNLEVRICPEDCSSLDDECNIGVCDTEAGQCVAQPKEDSTPCEDGDACTSETGAPGTPDHCEAGVCVGVPVDCSDAGDQCNDGVCDPESGACVQAPKPDSTPCEDGDICTSETGTPLTPDHCEAGVCVGVPVDCSEFDDQCNDGVCNAETGDCEAVPKADSTPCEDGNACTSETGAPQTPDHCEAGMCVGIPVDCSSAGDQCNDGVCDPESGACVQAPKPDSTPCEDGDVCTSETGVPQTPDHCEAGMCVGIPVDCSDLSDQCNDGVCNADTGACEAIPKADSTPCEDGDICTSETGTPLTPDHCESGVCVGIPVDCSDAGDQCNDGVCDPANGECVAQPKENSTPCEDGDVCTSETGAPQTPDHCEAGVCVGIPVDCSDLTDQCNDGVCNADTGACEAIPKEDSTPCEDGDICTSETGAPLTPDHCEAGVCVGIPIDCSEFDDQCNDGVCNPDTGACEAVPKEDSTPCEDGDVCTSETGAPMTPDHCEAGVCVGVPVDCSAEGDQCNDGVCNPDTGACESVPKADSTPCEDGLYCTSETGEPGTPDHCESGECVGIPVDCGPGDQCNDVACNDETDTCEFIPKEDSTPCEDGNVCTSETGTPMTPDHCEAGVCVGVPVDCSEFDDQCNQGVCNPTTGACESTFRPDSTPCEDGDTCTSETGEPLTPDHCESGECVGIPVDCDDGNECTLNTCLPSGECNTQFLPEGRTCDDGEACTSFDGTPGASDACNGLGECLGTPVDCDDGNACTADSCDANGQCVNDPLPPGAACDDGDACTSFDGAPGGADACDGAGVCLGTPVDCDDGNECTINTCLDTGECHTHYEPPGRVCDDGDTCTSFDGTPGAGDACNGLGECLGTPVNCDDGNECTADACNASGECVNDPLPPGAACDDGEACTSFDGTPGAADGCDGAGACLGMVVDCDDGNECTLNSCLPSGECNTQYLPEGRVCDDGDACTSFTGTPGAGDACNGNGQCLGTPVNCDDENVCTSDSCDASGECVNDPTPPGSPCDDGAACTSFDGTPGAADGCDGDGACLGTPVDCDDGNQCTTETCDPNNGECLMMYLPPGTVCTDEDACTSVDGTPGVGDACNAYGECLGTPIICEDDNSCTADSCNPTSGLCVFDPLPPGTGMCDDGNACTSFDGTPGGDDACDGAGGCQGAPVMCPDDGNQCTGEVCNEATGACDAFDLPDGTPCDNDEVCTTDQCEAGTCVSTPDLMVMKTCLVEQPPPISDACETGKPKKLVFEYTGEGCGATTNFQEGSFDCDGDPALAEPVEVIYTDGGDIEVVEDGETIFLGGDVTLFAFDTSHLSSNSSLEIYQGGVLLQSMTIHTSCSKELNVGDQFGSLRLVEYTSEDGIVTSLPEPQEPSDVCELPDLPPAPHCLGKVTAITFRYIGGDCTNTTNDQEGKVECSGDAGTSEPVEFVASIDVDPTGETVFLGDTVTLSDGGSNFGSTTEFEIQQGGATLQTLSIHTSCSKELNVGDVFGSVEVVALETTEGGLIQNGANVEYAYTVTNKGSETLFDITVEDTPLGTVPGSPIPELGPGESVTLTLTVFVSEPITNVVEVTATGSDGVCMDSDWAMVNGTTTGACGPVTGLVFMDRDMMEWDAAADAEVYDIIQGDLGQMRVNGTVGDASCQTEDSAANQWLASSVPPSGQGYYFVVRGDAPIMDPGTYDNPGMPPMGSEGRDLEVGSAGGSECAPMP